MNEQLGILSNMVGAQLAQEPRPSPERIRELIEHMRTTPLCRDVNDTEAEELALEFEERHGVTMSIGAVLQQKDYKPWLDHSRIEIEPYYWERYRKLLSQDRFSANVISTLDNVTDRILGLLENPNKPGQWDRRGMVVGHVQSGKTANYTGVICKAADAGYRLIVIIAGVHNNLRNQTQIRIDEGFVGRDSAGILSTKTDTTVGVGNFDRNKKKVPISFTTSIRDFNKAFATSLNIGLHNLNTPVVFVIKKNSSTLKNLLEWLREYSSREDGKSVDAPMLLIDDEADNASINTKHGKGEVTKINSQIRDLLNTFDRSCYVGYTATPFANIFIDPATEDEMLGEDLFPKDFIVSLDPPSNYFGANRVFLEDSERIILPIRDNEDYLPVKHPTDFQIAALPPSLRQAIESFILARAVRLLRRHENVHCSMLVNASIKNAVQLQLKSEVQQLLSELQQSIRINSGLPNRQALRDPILSNLKDTWEEIYQENSEYDWREIQSMLHKAAAPIKPVLINSKSKDSLDYKEHEKTGLNVIAIGGFSLSRGLTLEGLMVSYFLRNSMMYDTLMQMGRWFGYRPGYDDLCRIWMPEEAQGWYEHIAEATEELREELTEMQAAGATPEQFGLKVRSHPDTLIVTARNKMGTGENFRVSIGLGKSFIETSILRRDETSRDENRSAALQFSKQLDLAKAKKVTGGWLLSNIPAEPIMDFISAFRNHPGSLKTDPQPVRRYIEERSRDELNKWDVLIAGIKKLEPNGLFDDSLGVPINCQRRMEGGVIEDNVLSGTLPVTNKRRVASRGIEKTGITQNRIEVAEENYRRTHNDSTNYPDWIYRHVRSRPLLILHMLAIGKDNENLSNQQPTVAWSVSFPSTQKEEKRVEYVVNTTWWKENFQDELDDDELADDDD